MCEPVFKLLKKDVSIRWTDECQETFDKIKEYLSNPPVLVPPELKRPLFLYLTVLENSFGCVLRQHDVTGKREQAIYYMRRVAEWKVLLTEFDIVYVTCTTTKAQALADHLAENLVDDEYQPLACIMDMNIVVDMDVEELLIMGDFDLIIRQAQGEWETRDIKLIPYRQHMKDLRK
ncbi:uncharacterized protein LOC142170616 [Nicotiana tabacum]|uniref:Uncharacterized protein LOC142170616 n=1 Tax=Nicotiana tabacum TaxID=4097 RepID=A0AC58SUG2_TOBAC